MRILTAVLLASVPLGPLCQPASADETAASTGIRVVPSYENRGSGGGRGRCGCQNIKHFLQILRSLTLCDRVRLSYACSPLLGATKGNAFRAARIKLPCGVITPPWNNTISKRSRDHLVIRRAGPPVAQRGTRCHFPSWRSGPGSLANYH
jgi:hypothetical protein